ncbi:hypothetical protein [Erythrobacter crassostreae]|uniref:Uncharacterized protein n=1 Tax=Erythrobacter crassostreae TaxID=2828328 RepID=A0A9X1F4Z5_9SPHN|nr:hypothetical protein [Erythrobacter crassostrea]MBV7258905.1 hypothetical protein [Erythrobacter crassostrea]
MSLRSDGTWQIILADLALILFLLTLLAVPGASANKADDPPAQRAEFAPSQALFRPDTDGPGLDEWLRGQVRDPRATLTIHARYREGDSDAAWANAQALSKQARDLDWPVRLVITQSNSADLYASIGYDAPADETAGDDAN